MMPKTRASFSLTSAPVTEVGAALVFWVLFQTVPIFIPIKPLWVNVPPSCAIWGGKNLKMKEKKPS